MKEIALLDSYQDFTDTVAVFPKSDSLTYLSLGIADEAIELFEKVDDYCNSGTSYRGKGEHVLAECGDVLWYIAQELRRMNVSFGALALRPTPVCEHEASLLGAIGFLLRRAGFVAGRAKKTLRDGTDYSAQTVVALHQMVITIDTIARFFGQNIVLVSTQNTAKLSSRKDRATLRGDGDNR